MKEKMTKQIKLKNGEVILPIPHKVALRILEATRESSLILDKMTEIILSNIKKGNKEDVRENKTFLDYSRREDILFKEIQELRKKYDYWYFGTDNLDKEDIKIIS